MVGVKICGLTDQAAVRAALAGGARYLGFVFYPPSPRALTPDQAAALLAAVPDGVPKVGVFVNPEDRLLAEVLRSAPLDLLQIHQAGPARLQAIKAATGKKVIGCLSVAEPADLAPVGGYAEVADLLLFDARPPAAPASLPGGNGLAFDWRILADLRLARPWLLAGGLNQANLAAAVAACRPPLVDVSSGVEAAPGRKDPALVTAFLTLAAGLPAANPASASAAP